MISPYSQESEKTFMKITNNINSWYPNQLYYNIKYNKYFFINTKGYLHCYIIENKSIDEYMLTQENNLKWIRKIYFYKNEDKIDFIKYLKSANKI